MYIARLYAMQCYIGVRLSKSLKRLRVCKRVLIKYYRSVVAGASKMYIEEKQLGSRTRHALILFCAR